MKKRGMSSFYVVLFGIVIFILLLIPTGKIVGNVWNAFTGKSSGGDEKFFLELVESLLEVSNMPGDIAGKSYTFSLSRDSAVLLMNPNNNFSFAHEDGPGIVGRNYGHVLAREFERPYICQSNSLCVCLCKNPLPATEPGRTSNREHENLVCSQINCNSIEDFVIQEKIRPSEIFNLNEEVESYSSLEKYYWDNSFIFLRTNNIQRDYGLVQETTVVSGYRDMHLGDRFDVFIYKAGVRDGKPVISICFKKNPEDNCLPRTGPFQ